MFLSLKKPARLARVAALAWGGVGLAVAADGGGVDFSREVLPLLSEHCFACHGPDAAERKADLRLDTFEGATRDSGAIRPGEPGESLLMARVLSGDPDEIMPPPETGKSLTTSEREVLRRWIAEGAAYEAHWAFRPVVDAEPPPRDDGAYPAGVDRFLRSALAEAGLDFSPPVDRRTQIRRATFDLTGLPPTWEETKAFLADPRSDAEAFASVVDRLLDSAAYGERWGRHWLDLARYADTHGGSAIGFTRFPFSHTYRDYVIDAFNRDLPYDRFLLEQIAADQLGLAENDPALAGLGFLTVGMQHRNRHDQIDDQIDVVTRGLQGLTVSCARCHDHKFDPIPTTDYYALHATLSPSRPPTELPLVGQPEIDPGYRDEFDRRGRLRDDIVRDQGEVMRGRLRAQTGLYLRELAKGTPEQDTSTSFLSYRTEDIRPVILERWRRYLAAMDESDPVFGPWQRLAGLGDGEIFAQLCEQTVRKLIGENGDPKEYANEHLFATKAPKWNPRVLDALAAAKPASFPEVAEVYGEVFTAVHRRWLTALLDASLEAAPGAKVPTDQGAEHRVINSAIERQLRHHLYASGSPTDLSFEEDRKHLSMLNRGVRDPVAGTLNAIDALNLTPTAPPRAMALAEIVAPEPSFVFLRGNPVARGEAVAPRYLTALAGPEPTVFADGRRRLSLAEAIVDPANPLTRRVIVNWVWQHHFGAGLVRTPDDFGTRGDPPTHPELLDYLAARLLEDGWSLKKMHRRLMLTAAYRQGSRENPDARRIDPDNALLWRLPVRRLELEAMRDALLAVTGELSADSPRGGRPFEERDDKAVARRSVYAFVNRDVISRMAADFDGADPSACTVRRQRTTVPQQTLFALNSGFVQDRAAALAARDDIRAAATDAERVARLYRQALSREPGGDEIALALEYVGDAGNDDTAWARFAQVLLASNEFHFID